MKFSSRVLLCLIGVLRNASIWGDASIDTVSARMYGFSSNKITESKNCARPCKFNQPPRRCVFDFTVRESTLGNRTRLTINDLTPGPRIQVCHNDIVVVNVANKLVGGGEFGIHWHGVSQRGSPFMDGVPMITQCPITGGTTFSYSFIADRPGTHFYHAHSVSQHLDGLYGALLVKQPYPLEPGFPLYDYDRIPEDLFIISAITSNLGGVEPTHLIVDGNMEERKRSYVTANGRYRMRAINAIAVDCPVSMRVQGHQMIVIASDGAATRPVLADSFVLYPGERMDFILSADQTPSLYEFQIKGMIKCKHLSQITHIIYENLNVTYPEGESEEIFHIDPLSSKSLLATSGPPAELTVSPVSEQSVYLQIDTNSYDIDDDENEYRYLSDAMPVPAFYPSELTMGVGVKKITQINRKSFIYPNAPLLTQPEDVIKRTICPVGYESKSKYFECTQILEVDYKSTLELIIVDEGFGSDTEKTLHIHGNPMYVLYSSKSYADPITVDFVKELDGEEKIERNLLNPLKKDTIVVPNKGFVVVRIIANNLGTWMLECRGCGVSSLPTAVVLRVNGKLPEKITSVLPKCGNYKPADTLLN